MTKEEIIKTLSNIPGVSTTLLDEVSKKLNELEEVQKKYDELMDLHRRRYAP